MTKDEQVFQAYERLTREVDREFNAIHQRQASRMECCAGCSDCCRARLSVNRLEEAVMLQGLRNVPEADRLIMADQARTEAREYCPALDDEGRCKIYSLRPMICRSFGVPLRHPSAEPVVHPPRLDACDKNFRHVALKMLPAEDVLDQGQLDERLAKLDDDYRLEHDLPDGERVPIAQILIDAAGAATPHKPRPRDPFRISRSEHS